MGLMRRLQPCDAAIGRYRHCVLATACLSAVLTIVCMTFAAQSCFTAAEDGQYTQAYRGRGILRSSSLGSKHEALRDASKATKTRTSTSVRRLRLLLHEFAADGTAAACAAASVNEKPMSFRTARISAGARPVRVAVIVLSCLLPECAELRSQLRATLYNQSEIWRSQPSGVMYCSGGADSGGSERVSRREWEHAVDLRYFFVVGHKEGAAYASLMHEQREFGDVVLLPSGDTYHDLHEKILHALLWLHCVSGFDYDVMLKTDSDSFVRLPHVAWALRRLLPASVDAASPRRYTDILWGALMRADVRHLGVVPFVGGMGYALTRGAARSIVSQMLAAPLDTSRSTGGVVNAFGSAEDWGMSLLTMTRPHVTVNDRERLVDALPPETPAAQLGVNMAPVGPATLIVHRGTHAAAMRDLTAYFARVDADDSCAPPVGIRSDVVTLTIAG